MNRGDVLWVQDATGEWCECQSIWSGTRDEPGLLARWPSHSSLVSAAAISPAKGRKHVTPTPVAPPRA